MSANISILGNAGRDVSLRYTEKGTAVASFPIASNSFKNSSVEQTVGVVKFTANPVESCMHCAQPYYNSYYISKKGASAKSLKCP